MIDIVIFGCLFYFAEQPRALLTGCENYVSEDAWRSVELLSENQDYGEKDRELFYYQGDCTELEDNDSQYDAFAVLRFERLRMVAPVIRAICW